MDCLRKKKKKKSKNTQIPKYKEKAKAKNPKAGEMRMVAVELLGRVSPRPSVSVYRNLQRRDPERAGPR